MLQAAWAGSEIAHVFPFQEKLSRACKTFLNVEEFKERWMQWPAGKGMRDDGMLVSNDGLVGALVPHTVVLLVVLTCCRL